MAQDGADSVNKAVQQINSFYYGPELMKALDFLENNLNKNNGKYFAGDKLTGADILLSYPICDNIFSDPERAKVITGGFDVVTNIQP